MNTNAQTTDLIAQKNSEYDNLPGLILGLDGWILRSVPKQLRSQFLQGYEKLLKIVFHPDRFQDNRTKLSRQTYLQNVGEAVRFMLSDEFSYDMTTDTVPSHKNPLLELRNQINIRDGIISRTDDQLTTQTIQVNDLRRKSDRLQTQLMEATVAFERRTKLDYELNAISKGMVRKFPTPIGLKYANVRGSFLGFDEASMFVYQIGEYSSNKSLHQNIPWIDKHEWINLAKEQLSAPEDFSFRRRVCEKDGYTHTIVGALTIAHLCAIIRSYHNFPTTRLLPDKTIESLNWLLGEIEEEKKIDFQMRTAPFLFPFFTSNTLLLVRVRKMKVKTKDVRPPAVHRLLLVHSTDAELGPKDAIIKGLEQEIKDLRRNSMRLLEQASTYRDRIKNLEFELKLAQKPKVANKAEK